MLVEENDLNNSVESDNNENNDSQNTQEATNNNENNNSYPEGFDSETYDLESKSLKQDKVKEIFESSKKELESLQKQNLDLRKIVSKGKAPADIKDYEISYKPDSKFEKYYKEDESTKETFNSFNELAKNNGLNLEQHKAIVDFMNGVLVKTGAFDTRTQEEIESQKEEWIKEEKAKLGENADNIIKSNIEFVENFGGFNEEQKNSLKKFMGGGAVGISVVNSIKNAIFGSGRNEEIPTDINIGGLADDIALAREYKDNNTSNDRRAEILQQRIKAGRRNPLL